MARASSKNASKQKVQAGPSGKMQKFKPVGTQTPGGTAVKPKGGKK